MSEHVDMRSLERQRVELSGRVSALRAAHERSPESAPAILEAAFAELSVAEREFEACRDALEASAQEPIRPRSPAEREQRLLRAVFQRLPVPCLLVDHEGAVRRANPAALHLLCAGADFVVGRTFAGFVDPSARAVFRSHLANALHGGTASFVESRLAVRRGGEDVRLSISPVEVRGDPHPLACVAITTARALPAADAGEPDDSGLDEEMAVISARRLDVMARMTRLLLDEESLQEPVALYRAARLLAGEYAQWVVVDLVGDRGLRRAVVVGPDDAEGAVATQVLEEVDPAGVPLTRDVLDSSSPALHTLIEDDEVLGLTPGDGPVLTVLGATSALAVPLQDEHDDLGVLTLVRGVGWDRFDLADLGLLEELGEHLGLALRTERSYQRRTEAAEALQTSLLPRSLPSLPGLDVAAGYRAATEGVEVGGDFYDVFDSPGGWGVVLGDVCGKGEEAAAVTAMVRQGARLLALWEPDPAAVLRKINHAMVVQHETERFVTAVAAHLGRDGDAVRTRLACAGHPRPVVLRADGAVHFASGGGLPLGVFDDAEPHMETLTLAPGDMLLLYSDGVTETRDTEGELFGDGRLADVLARTFGLSATAAVKAIEDELHSFGDGRAHDDVALLAVRVLTA